MVLKVLAGGSDLVDRTRAQVLETSLLGAHQEIEASRREQIHRFEPKKSTDEVMRYGQELVLSSVQQ